MQLALGGTCANGSPADEVRDELGRHGVEELAAGGQAELVDLGEQFARDAQSLVDVEGAVEVRVVDQALPSDRRARLLEVDAHDDEQVVV